MTGMMMSSSVRTIIVTRDNENQLLLNEVDPANVSQVENEVFLHPMLIALTHTAILGDVLPMDMEEEKNKLTEDEFKNLETCSDVTNCAICMDNKKMNIKLKCAHVFCKSCIKKWLIEKSNTCPNCRIEI
tara:strand:+ start:73 stop:462 length:390 start_codon:yes stop_codon:yes gene_type:complete